MRKPDNTPDTYLVDLDGTVISYPSYAIKSFRAMMHVIMEATGHNEPVVKAAMRKHYSRGGFENPFLHQSLEDSGFLDDTTIGTEVLRRKLQQAFNASKTLHLGLYPGIADVLKDAREQGKEVIALTDASELATISKLKAHQTKLLGPKHFSRIIALDSSPRFHPGVSPEFIRMHSERLHKESRIPITLTSTAKPDSDLEGLLGYSTAQIQDTVGMLGDNYHRDMELAFRYHMQGYHALWGVNDLAEHQDEIMQFTAGAGPIQPAYYPESYPANIHPVTKPTDLYGRWGIQAKG